MAIRNFDGTSSQIRRNALFVHRLLHIPRFREKSHAIVSPAMNRMRLFRLLERAARPLRSAGLGRVVDRTRGAFERGLGEETVVADGVRLTGVIALHAGYLEEVRDASREALMTRLFGEALAPDALVVDVGAHLGWFSIRAARQGARVIAFEPNPDTRPLLERNLADNGVQDRVTVVGKAVAAEAGKLTFWRSPAGDTSSLLRPQEGERPVEVETVPLDEVLRGEAAPRVVKIDVEGAELDVIRGARETIARAPDLQLFAECNPEALARGGATPEQLWAALEDAGLAPRVIDEAAGALRGREALASIDGYVNLACRPATR